MKFRNSVKTTIFFRFHATIGYVCPVTNFMNSKENTSPPIEYFAISPTRLVILFILTLGFHTIYWFYRNWEALRKMGGQKVIPLIRGFLSWFYAFRLFKEISISSERHGHKMPVPPGLLATIYFLSLIVGSAILQFSHLLPEATLGLLIILYFLFIFLPLALIQRAINANNKKEGFSLTKKFSLVEKLFVLIGFITWISLFMG